MGLKSSPRASSSPFFWVCLTYSSNEGIWLVCPSCWILRPCTSAEVILHPCPPSKTLEVVVMHDDKLMVLSEGYPFPHKLPFPWLLLLRLSREFSTPWRHPLDGRWAFDLVNYLKAASSKAEIPIGPWERSPVRAKSSLHRLPLSAWPIGSVLPMQNPR